MKDVQIMRLEAAINQARRFITATDSTQEHVSCWRCGYTVPLETIAISSWRKNDIGWECDCCVAKHSDHWTKEVDECYTREASV